MIEEDIFQGIDFLIVESDGARQLPLKAPGENEPCIPSKADVVIGVMGMDALGKELRDGNVHRAEQMSRLLDQPLGSVISETTFRKLAMNEDGLFRNSPLGARKIMILNKAEGVEKRMLAEDIMKGILEQHDGIDDFLIASLEQEYIYKRLPLKLSLIVFGAGKSTRMGEQKLLMEMDGSSILEKVMRTVTKKAYLDPDRLGQVVTSETILVYHEDGVKAIGERYGIEKLVWNPEPERGMSSSLLLAAENIARDCDGYLFFMGDQPFLDDDTMTNILKLWLKDTTRIVVPYFAGKQGNPVLFPWELRDRLLRVTGDKGGRDVIKSSLDKVAFCEIEESTPGVDIDDRECYTRYKDGNR